MKKSKNSGHGKIEIKKVKFWSCHLFFKHSEPYARKSATTRQELEKNDGFKLDSSYSFCRAVCKAKGNIFTE